MSSRKEQKAQAREQRLERERQAAVAERRNRRRRNIGIGAAAVLVTAAIAGAVATGSGGGGGGAKTSAGLQVGPPPWPPETSNLPQRLASLQFPSVGNESYHVHAALSVYANGTQVPVPQGIGIDQASGTVAPLHTHDQSGTIHMESGTPYPFKLGQIFTIWGVEFTPTQLGGLRAAGANKLQVFVNGKPVANPVAYAPKSHDLIVVAYGKPGSAPKTFTHTFAAGE